MADQDPRPTPDAPDAPGPLPDKPRLRPLEAFPVDGHVQGQASSVLVLRDPSGLAEGTFSVPPLGAAVLDLCDGTYTRAEICAEFEKRYRLPLSPAALAGLLTRLDAALMLDSASFRRHAARIYADFARQEGRPAFFAGKAYPQDGALLHEQLGGFFAPPSGPGLPAEGAHLDAGAPPAPRAIVVPHVDFNRGGPAYAWAYRPLLLCDRLPSLIVILGTDHNAMDPGFTLTRKHFATPLGSLPTDTALCDELLQGAAEIDKDLPGRLLRDEHHHRGEHSLEFQIVWLRYVLSRRAGAAAEEAPRVLPLLCGSLQEVITASDKAPDRRDPMAWPQVGPFLQLLRERVAARVAAGESVLWVAAADLAHVGPRYGDKDPLDAGDCASLEHRDRETLRPVLSGDADGWFHELRRERDRRRVCGLSPIYSLLKAADVTDGQMRCYAQCQAESGSIVSIASLVF